MNRNGLIPLYYILNKMPNFQNTVVEVIHVKTGADQTPGGAINMTNTSML